MICSVLTRLGAATFALLATSGALLAQSAITPSVPSVNFSFAPDSTTSLSQAIKLTAPIPGGVNVVVSQNIRNFIGVLPSSQQLPISTAGTDITVTLNSPYLVFQGQALTPITGSITFTDVIGALAPLSIPVTLTPTGGGTGGGGGVTAFPSTLALSYTPGTSNAVQQTIQLTGVTTTLTATVSGLPNVSASSPVTSTSPFTTITLYPQFAPTTPSSGLLTLTSTATNLAVLTIPITLTPFGSGTSNITASPNALTYSYVSGTTTQIPQTVTLSAGFTTSLTPSLSANLAPYFSVPSSISTNGSFNLTLLSPLSFATVTSGTLTLTPSVAGTGLTPITIPITIQPGGTTGALTANPSTVVFVYAAGTNSPLSQNVTTSAPSNVVLTVGLSANLAAYMAVPSTVNSNTAFSVTLLYPSYFAAGTSGTLTLTPPASSGLNTLTVPIQINPGGTGTTGLSTSPASLFYSYASGTTAAQTQNLLISAPVFTNVNLTLSANLSPYFQYPFTATSGSQIAITLLNPQAIPFGTTGSLTLTPTNSALAPVTVPIYINSGTGGGTGTITATPASVTFNVQLNGAAPPDQLVTLTSPGGFGETFTASVVSTSDFLTVGYSSATTPSTLTLRVNPTALTAIGTYTGTITVTRLGAGGGVAATIPVTVNVTTAVRVTPNPTAVTLTSVAGSSAIASATVQLNADAAGTYSATTSTSSGQNWLSVSPANGSLGAGTSTSLTISANPTGLAAGSYSGTVTISANGSVAVSIPVTYTVTLNAALQLSQSSLTFSYQSGSTTPAAQTVQISSTTTGVPLSWTATPASTGGWLQVSPTSGTTPGTLSVSVNPSGLAAGTYSGSISVSSSGATNTPQTIAVTLNITTPSLPVVSAVLNAASLAPSVAVPGEIVTLRGTNLGPTTGVAGTVSQNFLGTSVSGVTVTFDGIAAPILYVSATQINAVVPYEVANRVSTRLVVTYQNQASREIELRVGDTAPAVFTSTGAGGGAAVALNQNGSINSAFNPEVRGNVIVLFGTGEGQTNPAGATGQVTGSTVTSLKTPALPVSVRIGGQAAEVLYVGSFPGAVAGAFQMNVRVPQTVSAGTLPLEIQIGTGTSPSGVTIVVQ